MATAQDDAGYLTLGGVRLADLARDARIGTPSYAYDLDAIAAEAGAIEAAFDDAPHLVAYAVKANSAGPIVRALAKAGCGADVVSGAELELAMACGVPAEKIVFSGVAKTDAEIDRAIGARIGAIQAESAEEITRIAARARALGQNARVAIRVNPGLDVEDLATHEHIATGHDEAKFGIPVQDLASAIEVFRDSTGFALVGISAHVGSQLTSTAPYVAAARVLFDVALSVRANGRKLEFVDTGGGFGIDYGEGCDAKPADFIRAVRAEQARAGLGNVALHVEPGRSIVAAHGVVIAKVIQTKRTGDDRAWLMIDAGMNDLIRPALYRARHRVVPLEPSAGGTGARAYRVVGPVCESSDDFGEHVLAHTDHVALLDAGAYGYTMASRYNGRALPAEVFLRAGRIAAISPRETDGAWARERAAIVEA